MLRPNYRGFAQKAAVFPLRVVGLARHLAGRLGRVLADRRRRRPRRGPAERPLHRPRAWSPTSSEVLSDPDRTNDFRLLERELYLTATDLDTCERVILGEGEWSDVPISKAVECSTALPIVYEPVDLKGRQLVDGGHPLDHQRRHRGRARRQVHRRRQPAGPLRQRLLEADPDHLRDQGAPRLRHGAAGDRQPGLQADGPRPPAPGGRRLAREVPRRRHHPDRARAQRRADVRHLDPRLLGRACRSPSTASSRSPSRSPRTIGATRRSPSGTGSRSRPAGCAR